MSARKSTTARPKSQLIIKTLSPDQIRRITEKLAIELGNDSENIAPMTLLLEQLSRLRPNLQMFAANVSIIKDQLFANTTEASDAQVQFEAEAFRNRGKLLQWPSERKGAA